MTDGKVIAEDTSAESTPAFAVDSARSHVPTVPTAVSTLLAEEDDEEIIVPTQVPDETIQIQGSDRTFPSVVRRRSKSVDKNRTTLQTISKYGRWAELYSTYESDIAAYKERRANRLAERANRLAERANTPAGSRANTEEDSANRSGQAARGDHAGGYSATRGEWPLLPSVGTKGGNKDARKGGI